ncbi:MAG: mycofactocin biosynthesis glycosyltransferase MftF [Desulfomonilaceae bacterium]
MTRPGMRGLYCLASGIRLIPQNGYGVILKDDPFRAFRVNLGALRLLEKCRTGFSPESEAQSWSPDSIKAALAVFDRFVETGVLEWKPSESGVLAFVSIVIPVYNRADDIRSCLESLLALDYPTSQFEIIVVDDKSSDKTANVVKSYGVKLIVQPKNLGQSAARNEGVLASKGEIIAFIDSDCIAGPCWLSELVPYFEDPRNALVGGYVDSYYRETWLDRYEEANSPLNMGQKFIMGFGSQSDFYVPTCNMLVRRDAYLKVGGLDETMRVGEDVDFCWRLKENGFRLVYVPKGRIEHKHRNRFLETFGRRFDYGASEPVLYSKHKDVEKRFPWQPACMALLFTCLFGLLWRNIIALPLATAILVADSFLKKASYEKQIGMPLPFKNILKATAEKHFNLIFYLTHHVIRYYLVLITVVVVMCPSLLPAAVTAIVFTSLVEFIRKKPRLLFPVFFFYFVIEQAYYQTGVFVDCLKRKSFRPYKLNFMRTHKVTTFAGSRSRTGSLYEKA